MKHPILTCSEVQNFMDTEALVYATKQTKKKKLSFARLEVCLTGKIMVKVTYHTEDNLILETVYAGKSISEAVDAYNEL